MYFLTTPKYNGYFKQTLRRYYGIVKYRDKNSFVIRDQEESCAYCSVVLQSIFTHVHQFHAGHLGIFGDALIAVEFFVIDLRYA